MSSRTYIEPKHKNSVIISSTLKKPSVDRSFKSESEDANKTNSSVNHSFSNLNVYNGQTFAQSCPLSLSNPGVCPFGSACHTCPVKVQTKLKVGQAGDEYEQEAERISEQVMNIPESQVLKKDINHRSDCSTNLQLIFFRTLNSSGQPLDHETSMFMESRFGYNFSHVRIHTDSNAVESVRAMNAIGYTVGNDIFISKEWYKPRTLFGKHILAHELTHVIQQGYKSPSYGQHERPAMDVKSSLNHSDSNLLSEERSSTPLMMIRPDQFRKQLGSTPDQKKVINVLFSNKTFARLWNYLKNCSSKPQKDLGPLKLKVTPGLKKGGIERFGGYNSVTRTLEINPTKPEHKSNPSELVDTIVHELIHAVDDLEAECLKTGSKVAPLAGASTEYPPKRSTVKGSAKEKQLMQELGPGASNPCDEFLDINKAAQQMIIQILRSNIQTTKIGHPTVTFVNEILRREPKAMNEYSKCRDVACALAKPVDRNSAIAQCSADIITKYMPKDLKP